MTNKNIKPIVMLVAVMICFTGISLKVGSNMNSSTSTSEALYDKIMSYDLDNNYPDTPQKVMDVYIDCLSYLYGGKVNSTKIMDIVIVQRKLYAKELLDLNQDADVQYTTTLLNIDKNKQSKFSFISTIQNPPVYYDEDDAGKCSIKLTQFSNIKPEENASTDLETDYYLIKNSSGEWKIIGWEDIKDEQK